MKAVVQERYGSPDEVLQLREIDKPVPKDDEVLVGVRAASMHPDIWHAVTGLPYILRIMGMGLRKPKVRIPGTDLAGHVESLGKNVTRFKVGDEVFGESSLRLFGFGDTYAEYATVPQDALALKPRNVSFEQAAVVPTSGSVALLSLGLAGTLNADKHVLINGAGGCVGSIAIQIAKAKGARVTGIDCTEKLAMMRLLGADHVIDYRKENFLVRSELYDFILDVATTLSFVDCKRVLTPTGLYWATGHGNYGVGAGGKLFGHGMLPFGMFARIPFDKQLPKINLKPPSKQDTFTALQALLESGKLAPIIAKTFPLSEVPTAIRCLQEGRTPGRIIITP
ncbi:MAG: NAD(P)-dependent alcohol dehydrogenase [Candidatus Obscuribacterales bacterium]|nr:NAD(P)-dependent alcohol dehydrogenase [Steroidobacteraceae bacterium]